MNLATQIQCSNCLKIANKCRRLALALGKRACVECGELIAACSCSKTRKR